MKSTISEAEVRSRLEDVRSYFILIFKDVSREFDEFQVNTHLCKLRCWYS